MEIAEIKVSVPASINNKLELLVTLHNKKTGSVQAWNSYGYPH